VVCNEVIEKVGEIEAKKQKKKGGIEKMKKKLE
jgi:hypothetical protein